MTGDDADPGRLRRELIDGGVDAKRVGLVPVGVDTVRYAGITDANKRRAKGQVLNANPRTLVILSKMPLDPETRPELLLQALQYILQDVASVAIWEREFDDILLIVIGMGDSFQAFSARSQADGLGGQVRLLPSVSKPETYMRAADIFVHTGASEKLSPVVIAEAMAAGLPVIAVRGGPVTDLSSDDDTTAKLIDFVDDDGRDARQLADAILDLAFDANLREKLAKAASRLIRSTYDLNKASALVVSERQQALRAAPLHYDHDGRFPNPSTAFGLLYLAVKDRLVSDIGVVQSRLAEVRHSRTLN